MNRSIIAFLVATLCFAWWAYPENPEIKAPMVPVISESTPASGVPNLMAYPHNVAVAPALPVSRAISPVNALVEQDQKGYKQSKAYRAFIDRRSAILRKYRDEVNKPRLDQGLEPFPEPKVEPTPEELTAMISEFQAGIRQLDEVTMQEGSPSINIVDLLGDLHDAGIVPTALGTEAFNAVVRLGQAQADYQAQYVERLLERGCFGTAGYIMSMYVNRIAQVLDDPGSMGYTHLNGQILALHAIERRYARASTEEATDAVVANLARQRAKSIPGCGFG